MVFGLPAASCFTSTYKAPEIVLFFGFRRAAPFRFTGVVPAAGTASRPRRAAGRLRELARGFAPSIKKA